MGTKNFLGYEPNTSKIVGYVVWLRLQFCISDDNDQHMVTTTTSRADPVPVRHEGHARQVQLRSPWQSGGDVTLIQTVAVHRTERGAITTTLC